MARRRNPRNIDHHRHLLRAMHRIGNRNLRSVYGYTAYPLAICVIRRYTHAQRLRFLYILHTYKGAHRRHTLHQRRGTANRYFFPAYLRLGEVNAFRQLSIYHNIHRHLLRHQRFHNSLHSRWRFADNIITRTAACHGNLNRNGNRIAVHSVFQCGKVQ